MTPLTLQPGSVARSSFASLLGLLHWDATPATGAAGVSSPGNGDPKTQDAVATAGVPFWVARMNETVLGGLMGRGIDPKSFRWLMALERLEVADGRVLADGFCGVTPTDGGTLHVCVHRKGEGFYYAGMPASEVATRLHEEAGGLRCVLEFPVATGLRAGRSPALEPTVLAGFTAEWLEFWRPAVNAALGRQENEALALGEATTLTPADGALGLRPVGSGSGRVVFFGPTATAGDDLRFLPALLHDVADATTLAAWSAAGNDRTLEFLHRDPQGMPAIVRLREHVPTDGSASLERWLPALRFGPIPRADTALSEALHQQGRFELLWEGETQPSRRLLSRAGETLAVENPGGAAESDNPPQVVFERGGFVQGRYALAQTADGRCARLTLADPHALDALPRFATSAARLEPWSDGTLGCGVLLQIPAAATPDPFPARFSLSKTHFSVGPLREQELRADDKLTIREAAAPGFSVVELEPGGSSPTGGTAPPPPPPPASLRVTLSLPTALAYRLWEEWDIAHTQAALAKSSVGGYYREFNEVKKYNLLVILFSEIVLLNHALNRDISMEEMIARLEEVGAEALAQDKALRETVVAKILALVEMLPGIKQKLELMASLYPYYWLHQESAWLEAAFGAKTAAGLQDSLRKRTVPLVRRQVRTVQANLGRALAEIEAAARPIDGLLSRNEIRKSWSARARKYVPIGVQGASALAMVTLTHGAYGWTGLGTFLASGVLGNLFEGLTQDAESVHQIGRAAQSIFPWWRVFMRALVTTQFEFSQFIDDENLLAMKRDRALLDKTTGNGNKEAATGRLVAALRERIIEERRNRFAEVLAGSGVRLANVVSDLQQTIQNEAPQDVAEFIQMLQPGRSEKNEPSHANRPTRDTP